MYAAVAEWRRENPELAKAASGRGGRRTLRRGFPDDAALAEQVRWFRNEFLRLYRKTTDPKEKAGILKIAFMATLKSESAGTNEDEQYREHLEKMLEKQQARVKKE